MRRVKKPLPSEERRQEKTEADLKMMQDKTEEEAENSGKG